MKTPICEICLKSGILCPGCQAKLSSGEISELEVKISKLLHELVDKYNIPKNINFLKAQEFDNVIILIVGKNEVGNIVGKGGKILKILQKEIHKKIRVLEDTDDIKKIAQDLVYPARILGINIVYLPDGEKKKIRISSEDAKKLPMSIDNIKEIILHLNGEEIDVVLE